ncbi:MAG: hypothetical protein NWR67_10995 [Saprospiraceae bacterium]|nr:hypothetical protein [Saprospiraceae bacterium]MDP4821527.1 hypothetical protein [Saprospiraceae bacterium]MDP4997725.1 hypothetical protein [Saprospiraceae bacterium]
MRRKYYRQLPFLTVSGDALPMRRKLSIFMVLKGIAGRQQRSVYDN